MKNSTNSGTFWYYKSKTLAKCAGELATKVDPQKKTDITNYDRIDVCFMLQAYAIEVCLKAILVEKHGIYENGRFDLKKVGLENKDGHKCDRLAEKTGINFEFCDVERNWLGYLELYSASYGRYPLGKDASIYDQKQYMDTDAKFHKPDFNRDWPLLISIYQKIESQYHRNR